MKNLCIEHIRDKAEFKAAFDSNHVIRTSVEKYIASENIRNRDWHLPGYCEVCERPTDFRFDWENASDTPGGRMPSYRERMFCRWCGLNNRQRFMAAYLKRTADQIQKDCKSVYLYEQVTQFFKTFTGMNRTFRVIGSEYLGFDRKPGEIVNGIRHEDALHLTLEDGSIDIMVSNDVFEHVPDIDQTLREAHRVLHKGGKLLFSVPFFAGDDSTKRRAVIKGSNIVHLLPEHFHGNPVSAKGSLVFYDFGWDLIDFCKNAGFSDAYMASYYSLMYGYMGEGMQYMFVAEK